MYAFCGHQAHFSINAYKNFYDYDDEMCTPSPDSYNLNFIDNPYEFVSAQCGDEVSNP